MRTFIVATTAAAALCLPVHGGPFDASRVAADAQWLVHLDVQAFKRSTIGEILLEGGDRFDFDLDELDEIKRELGIDPRQDVMSITAYGVSDDFEDGGVIIAVTNEKADEALARLTTHEDDIRTIELDGNTVHVLFDGNDRHYIHVRDADRGRRRLVVVSSDKRAMANALEVIDDRAASLSMGRSSFMGSGPGDDSILFAAAGDVGAFHDIEPASMILKLSDGFTVDIGEKDGDLVAAATVSATSDENAENISSVVEGIIALGLLASQHEPKMRPLKNLVRAIDISARGRRITVRFRYDTTRLIEHVEELDGNHHHRDYGRAHSHDHDDDDDDDD